MSVQMNAVKHEKVENLNQIFTEVQRDVTSISKSVAPPPPKPMQVQGPKSLSNVPFMCPGNNETLCQ